jgi:hypothetical protein
VDDRVVRLERQGAAISFECLVIASLNIEQTGDVVPGPAGFWRASQNLLIGGQRIAHTLQALEADGAAVGQPQVVGMALQTVGEDGERLICPSLVEKNPAQPDIYPWALPSVATRPQ